MKKHLSNLSTVWLPYLHHNFTAKKFKKGCHIENAIKTGGVEECIQITR